jgi:hypothetical protein
MTPREAGKGSDAPEFPLHGRAELGDVIPSPAQLRADITGADVPDRNRKANHVMKLPAGLAAADALA